MSAQAQLQRCRIFAASLVAPTQPSGSNLGSDPHITMSPVAPTGGRTTGFSFFVEGVLETYAITCWKRDPSSLRWAILFTTGTTNLAGDTWASVCQVNASELYFQSTDGDERAPDAGIIHFEEFGV